MKKRQITKGVPEINLHMYCQLIYDREAKSIQTGKNSTWKGCQHHSPSGNCKSKLQWDYHLMPVRMPTIEKTGDKHWPLCGEKGTLVHCCYNVNGCSHYGKQYAGSSKN